MNKRIGIFGGSFNPIHNGHIALAKQLRQLAELDEVWLMVSPQNPLKQGSTELLDDHLRYAMARIALHGEQDLVASGYELHLPRPSYTWNTLCHLSEDFPQTDFTLLIGADNWQLFPHWYRADEIIKRFPIVIYPRQGSPVNTAHLPDNVRLVETELHNVSSTEVRQLVRQNMSIKGKVPPVLEPMVRHCYQ